MGGINVNEHQVKKQNCLCACKVYSLNSISWGSHMLEASLQANALLHIHFDRKNAPVCIYPSYWLGQREDGEHPFVSPQDPLCNAFQSAKG